MRKAIGLLAILFGALPVQGASISTSGIQDVRFSPPAVLTDSVIPPKLVWHPSALYTDEVRRCGVEGSVIVQAEFDEYCSATVSKVIKGLGYGANEAVLEALKGWRFSPALRNGLPVTAVAVIEVPFRLPDLERMEKLKRRLEELQQVRQSLEKWISAIEDANRKRKLGE